MTINVVATAYCSLQLPHQLLFMCSSPTHDSERAVYVGNQYLKKSFKVQETIRLIYCEEWQLEDGYAALVVSTTSVINQCNHKVCPYYTCSKLCQHNIHKLKPSGHTNTESLPYMCRTLRITDPPLSKSILWLLYCSI